jgi:O-antigen/teichoic acid export membrane protein
MFSYASRLLLIGLLETSFYYIYYLIIGKYFSAESLGYYTRAKSTQSLPVNGTIEIVSKVAFPAFIQVQNDPVKLKQGGQKAITSLVFIIYPVLIGILVTAKQFIVVVFGNKWLPSVPYLQIMCLIGLFYPLQTINLNILSAIGRSDLFFRIEVIKKILIFISIIIAIHFGIIALLTGELIVSFISFFINSHYSGVLINYKASNQLKEIAPYFVSAIAMGIVVFGITQLIGNFNTYLLFLTQIMTGTAVYITISILFKFSPLGEIRLLILQYFHKLHTVR